MRWLLVRTGKPSAKLWQEERDWKLKLRCFSTSLLPSAAVTPPALFPQEEGGSLFWVYSQFTATCCRPSFPLLMQSCLLWLPLSPTSKRFILFNTRVLSMVLANTVAPEQKSSLIACKNLHLAVSSLKFFPVHYCVNYKMYWFAVIQMGYFIRGNNKPTSFSPLVIKNSGVAMLFLKGMCHCSLWRAVTNSFTSWLDKG